MTNLTPPSSAPSVLKPCPFCGGSPYLCRETTTGHTTRSEYHWVRCHGCGSDGNRSDDKSWAIAAWNRRSDPIRGGVVEAMKAMTADYISPECTMAEAAGHLLREFERRAQIAHDALTKAEEGR